MRFPHNLSSIRRAARLISRNDFDVVHAHLARDYLPTALSVLASRREHVRLFFTRHVLFPLGGIHKFTFARASRVVAVSRPVADGLRAQRLCAPEKIVCVRNGIDLENFRSVYGVRAASERGEKFTVGMLGEINPLKGQETFVRAARILAERFPATQFLIAGADASRDGTHLRRLTGVIRQFDLSSRVQLLGRLEHERVAPYLASLDVFVSASHSESFGLSIVEACASGVPAVVATATAGASEIIENDVNGKLVPIGDATSMAEAIGRLLSDGDERRKLASRAQSKVGEDFSLTRMVDETERLYQTSPRENI